MKIPLRYMISFSRLTRINRKAIQAKYENRNKITPRNGNHEEGHFQKALGLNH